MSEWDTTGDAWGATPGGATDYNDGGHTGADTNWGGEASGGQDHGGSAEATGFGQDG